MKNQKIRFNTLFAILTLLVTSCSSDNDPNPKDNEETSEIIITTKTNLLGAWKLVSSTIDNTPVSSLEFDCLKKSFAIFNEDNTYSLNFKKKGTSTSSVCSQTNTQSGTYTITGLNSVTFFNSTSEIKLIDDTLQITSTITNTSSQVDIFVRSDNEEFKDETTEESQDIGVSEDDMGTTNIPINTFDGTAVIAKLAGKWVIDNTSEACLKKNTIEFNSKTVFEFTQHKKDFNRNDLLNYNINVSYPLPFSFNGTFTQGNNNVVFDTEADCQFIKKNTLNYIVEDEKTILIKNFPKVKILIENDTTIKLISEFTDANSNTKTLEFDYVKM